MTKHTKLSSACIDENGSPISLSSEFPALIKEWDYERNEKTPSIVGPKAGYDAFWICPKGHHYNTQVYKRTARGDGCPYCSGKKILPGFNDLTVTNPELIDEWHPKNDLSPLDVSAGSNKRVWWICRDCGHEWEALISNRSRGSGCPNCRYKNAVRTRMKTLLDERETFASAHPELLKEWDYFRNKDIADPEKITKSSAINVNWRCPNCGHHWQATPNNRSKGYGHCPKCSYGSKRYLKRHKT